MRPRIFHELSRYLAILLEKGIQGKSGDNRIPVFLSHPVEALEGSEQPEGARAAAVLYLYRVSPDSTLRQTGVSFEDGSTPGAPNAVRYPGLWVRLRYAFLVVGGTLTDELGVLAAAMKTLHDNAFLKVSGLTGNSADEIGLGGGAPLGVSEFPVFLVEEPEVWREIGLEEHRLAINFEVFVPLPSGRQEEVEPVLDRDLRLESQTAGEGDAGR